MNELPRILGISRVIKSLKFKPVFSQKSLNAMETTTSTHVILDGEEKWFKLIWQQWFYFISCDGCGRCDSVCAVKLSDMPAIITINCSLLNVNIWSIQSGHTVKLVYVASILLLWLNWLCLVHSQWCVETCRLTFIDCHTPHIHVLDEVSWLSMCVSYNVHFHMLRFQICVYVCVLCVVCCFNRYACYNCGIHTLVDHTERVKSISKDDHFYHIVPLQCTWLGRE